MRDGCALISPRPSSKSMLGTSISIATNEWTFQNRRYGLERDVASRARIGVDPQFQTRRYVNITVNGLYE
jgi:hypothetical protein